MAKPPIWACIVRPLAETASLARTVGLAILGAMLGLHLWLADSQDLSWRDGWWDLMHQLSPRERGDPDKAPAVVIAIDEDTMAQTQRWPWPRDLLGRLIDEIAAQGATVVALDVILDDTDPQSPLAQARRFRSRGQTQAGDLLQSLGDTDIDLARAINTNRERHGVTTILPVPGVRGFVGVNPAVECRFQKPIVLLEPPSIRQDLGVGFVSADAPLPLFREAGAALAAIDFSSSSDFVVRKIPAVQPICDAPFLVLGAEALRLARQGFYSKVTETWSGLKIWLDDPSNPEALSFPVERDGTFWLHYGKLGVERADGRGRELRRYISAREVMDPGFDATRLAGRIALIAVIDVGRIDERRSPLGPVIYGIEAHMQMIEQIANGQFLRRPWFMPTIEAVLLAILGLGIVLLVPRMGAGWAVISIAALIGSLLAGAGAAFRLGLLIDIATPAIGLSLISAAVMAATLAERDRQRLVAQVALQTERADRAFLQGELDAAARIQKALLPPAHFAGPGKVDLACHIEPARTVGGDFYDHCMLDDQHLFFLVADVSGKGADASQFMLLSKTLWKSVALRTGPALERIQVQANSEITRENAATMFVTGLCGVLNLETGLLHYSQAGHDAAFLLRQGRTPAQLESFSGPPVGLIEDMAFPVGQVQMNPGDRLCLFTDGVTEAMNPAGSLFGLDHLAATLATAGPDLDSAGIVDHVTRTVRQFSAGAEQSDDLTIMVVTLPQAGDWPS